MKCDFELSLRGGKKNLKMQLKIFEGMKLLTQKRSPTNIWWKDGDVSIFVLP